MRITGPDNYHLSCDAKTFSVSCAAGTAKFSRPATSKLLKLYIASLAGEPVYVGVTKQPMRNRLRLGWSASGVGGYYGYAWRHKLSEVDLHIWYDEDAPSQNSVFDMETVEAEVVFLIRSAGQWPLFQTEIHFHPSEKKHKDIAADIVARYNLPKQRAR